MFSAAAGVVAAVVADFSPVSSSASSKICLFVAADVMAADAGAAGVGAAAIDEFEPEATRDS